MKTRITERDIDVLRWIALLKHLSTSLIAQFFFNGNNKVARRRLNRLSTNNGFLKWIEKPSASQGRWERIYYLNKQYREEIRCLLKTEDIICYSPPQNPVFVNHDLEIARFLLCLKTTCEIHGGYSFSCFLGHQARSLERNWHEKESLPFIGRKKASFIPDSMIVLHGKKGKALLFLEIDTGNESITGSFRNTANFSKKLKAYMDYLDCQGYRSLSKKLNYEFKGFRVLVVTTPSRMNKLEGLCENISSRGVVWITTFDKVNTKKIFSPIWLVPCSNKKERQAIVTN